MVEIGSIKRNASAAYFAKDNDVKDFAYDFNQELNLIGICNVGIPRPCICFEETELFEALTSRVLVLICTRWSSAAVNLLPHRIQRS